MPALCRLHWWVHRVHSLERERSLPRSRYWYSAERHPAAAPWLEQREAWRGRAERVARIPLAPWPAGWLADALCVHSYEGAWNAVDPTGTYRGGMQFDEGTWLANGGAAYAPRADLASPRDQLLVALATWRARGWEPWPNTAAECGLL